MGADRFALEAVVVAAAKRGGGGGPDDGESGLVDAVLDAFGSETWDLVLEVVAPNGHRFEHRGSHRVANRLGGIRKVFTAWQPVPGLRLPVRISADGRDVEVDWGEFVRRGGIDEAVRLGAALRSRNAGAQGAAATGQMLSKRPKLAVKLRTMALAQGPEMAAQVTTGVRPAQEFSQWVSGLVQGGALEPHEGDALLRAAGILPG